ncbi:MAG: hypothetical protein K2H82_09445 [Oscillospiraceae bacterium]|nr:hypothetical protein [Oscillospiraceae bacterium]
MNTDEKILKLVDITTGTNIDAGQLATLLSILGKLGRSDVAKVVWTAIGTANALSCIKAEAPTQEKEDE